MRLRFIAVPPMFLCTLALLPGLASSGEATDPPGYTVELIWSASDNAEAVGVGTDAVTAIVGDTLTLDVYLSVFDDGPTVNSLYSYALSIGYDPNLVSADNYLPAAENCTGEPPFEICEEGSIWLKRSGGTILLETLSPSTPPGEDPDNDNTIHLDQGGMEIGIVGSIQGDGPLDFPSCTDVNEQAANDRVLIASIDLTVLPGFATGTQADSLIRQVIGAQEAIFSTCADEVAVEDVDLRSATIIPEPAFAALQLVALGCLAGLRRRRTAS